MQIHYKTLKRVFDYAKGSFYRLNASSARFYSFSLLPKVKGKIDFQGGYSWGSLDGETFLLDLNTGKLVTEKAV